MFSFLLPLVLVPSFVVSKMVYIAVRENITQPCPNMRSDVIDRSSLKLSFEMIDGSEAEDQATITDVNGVTKVISFPACYRAKLSFRVLKPIKNPYVEAFLQLGQNIPCKADGRGESAVENICTNITRTNWCPQSKNEQLRYMLRNKQTCSFCHACSENAGLGEDEARTFQKYIVNEGSQECAVGEDEQSLTFKMCTPSKSEMTDRGDDDREKLQEYWNYLKQGVLTAVVHVVDREEVDNGRKAQCRQMCETYENRKGVSQSYRKSLLNSIERLCAPQDNYAACVYHTVKFDINGEF